MKQIKFDTSRISALSDGVFAIAMTLLILDLKLPDIGTNLPSADFANAIKHQSPRFLSWIISFAVLCRLWITQHSLLIVGDERSRVFLGWNFLFLGMVSFLPFSTSLLSEHHEQWLSVAIFSASLAVGGLALFGMVKCLIRDDKSGDESLSNDEGFAKRAVFVLVLTAALSTLVALFSPPVGATVWVAFPVFATLLEFVLETRNLNKGSLGE